MNFIEQVIKHTTKNESPTSFWKWSAIATIGAVLRDKTYLQTRYGPIYPNLYALLIAKTGERKDPPIRLCEEFVRRLNNTRVISGRATAEAIMDKLQTSVTNPRTGKRDVVNGSSGILVAGELSSSLVATDSLIKVLTDLYDFKPNPFEDIRRSREMVILEKIVFSLFGGTNITMSKDIITKVAITGGLLGRTLIITPDEWRPGDVGVKFDFEKHKKELDECTIYLKRIVACCEGEWKMEENAYAFFEEWYLPFRERTRELDDPIGIRARMHTAIHKVAMIYAANDLSFPCIRRIHYEEAARDCLELLPNYRSFHMSNGRSQLTEQLAIVIQELVDAKEHRISRKRLLMDHLADLDLEDLDKIIQKLTHIGFVDEFHQRNETYYQFTEMGKRQFATEKLVKS